MTEGKAQGATATTSNWLVLVPAVFVLIWASGYVVARFGMPHGPPLTFLAWRFGLSLLVFGLWMALSRLWQGAWPAWPQNRNQWMHLAVVGMLMHAGYLGGVWAAVKAGIGAGLSALIVNFQPVLTALWVAYWGGLVTKRQWWGLLIGFVGLVLVMSRKFGVGGEATAVNVGLCVFALLAMTTGALYQKRFVQACDVRTATWVQLAAGFCVMLPLSQFEQEPMRWAGSFALLGMHWNGELLGAMVFSVLVLTLGGSSLLYILLQRGAATQVTSLLYLVPPVTAVMAWLLFGETLTTLSLIGMGMVAFGVVLVVRQPTQKP